MNDVCSKIPEFFHQSRQAHHRVSAHEAWHLLRPVSDAIHLLLEPLTKGDAKVEFLSTDKGRGKISFGLGFVFGSS